MFRLRSPRLATLLLCVALWIGPLALGIPSAHAAHSAAVDGHPDHDLALFQSTPAASPEPVDGETDAADVSFVADADVQVEYQLPSTNFGEEPNLMVKLDPPVVSYLRFNVEGVGDSIEVATLRIFAIDGTADGLTVSPVDSDWSESDITWNSRLRSSGQPGTMTDPISANSWLEVDVTRFVTGDGIYSFALSAKSDDDAIFLARENDQNRPELVVRAAEESQIASPPPETSPEASPEPPPSVEPTQPPFATPIRPSPTAEETVPATPVATETNTPAPTATATATATAAPTATPTNTATSAPSPVAQATPVSTETPVPTETATTPATPVPPAATPVASPVLPEVPTIAASPVATESPTETGSPTAASPTAIAEPESAMFRGGASRAGEFSGSGPTAEPDVEWSLETRGDIVSSAAVLDGVVYVGSLDSGLYALDAGNGRERWRFDTDGEVASSPAVFQDMVFVGSSDGSLYAIDAGSGDELWSAEAGQIVGGPAVEDGVVYVGSWDGAIYAFDA